MGVISSQMYPHWFDMPEGKEGGFAFMEKRRAEFWKLREQEEAAREKLAKDYGARRPTKKQSCR